MLPEGLSLTHNSTREKKLSQAGDARKESVRNQSLRRVRRKSCRDASLRPRGQTGGLGLAE